MKKILLTGLAFFLFSASFVLLHGFTDHNMAVPMGTTTDTTCGNDQFYGTNFNEFVQGVARYRKYHVEPFEATYRNVSSQGSAFQDSRSFWYSIDSLEKFICLLKQYAYVDGITTDQLGIRFYYGMYKDPQIMGLKHPYLPPPPNYGGLHTLFLVPTMTGENGQIVDFDPKGLANAVNLANMQQVKRPEFKVKETIIPAEVRALRRDSFTYRRMLERGTVNITPLMMNAIITDNAQAEKNQGQLCPPGCPNLSILHVIDSTTPDNLVTNNQ